MTERKRTVAIQVRVTEREKRQMERRARRCGLTLSGYLRRVGGERNVSGLSCQEFRTLCQTVNGLRENLRTQTYEETLGRLDELAGQILTAYTESEGDDGDNEDLGG